MFTVYVLYSPSYHKIYIGFTSDLENRIRSHNIFATKGWTVKYRPWILIYTEVYATKNEAMKREKNLKGSMGRTEIWDMIKMQKNN